MIREGYRVLLKRGNKIVGMTMFFREGFSSYSPYHVYGEKVSIGLYLENVKQLGIRKEKIRQFVIELPHTVDCGESAVIRMKKALK